MAKSKKKTSYVVPVFIIFILFALGGFYVTLSAIGNLRNDLKNLELAFELSQRENTVVSEAAPTAEETEESQTSKTEPQEGLTVIPTAIIFEALSSPLLQPQTNVTITIESISKADDGLVSINLKAFTNEATSYSALQPQNLFELIDLSTGGASMKPVGTEGSFGSIPPKSAVSGSVLFKIDPSLSSIILQVNYNNTIKYYELNFKRRTYKETVLG